MRRLTNRSSTITTTTSQLPFLSFRLQSAAAFDDRAERKKKAQEKWQQHDDHWDQDPFADQQVDADRPTDDPYEDLIAAHRVLGTRPGDPLYRVKLSYMMRCRETHPEVDGNPATFYKIALAYERILKDRGVEMRDGRIQFSESLPKLPFGHDPMADASRAVLIKAAQEVPGVDRYDRCEALERLREVRMSLAGTSELLSHPAAPPVSEMKAIERLELVHDVLLTPQSLKGLAWFQQPHRMSVAEIEARDGKEIAAALDAIVAPPHLQLEFGGIQKVAEQALLEAKREDKESKEAEEEAAKEEKLIGKNSSSRSSSTSSNDISSSGNHVTSTPVGLDGTCMPTPSELAAMTPEQRLDAKNKEVATRLLRTDPTLENFSPELLLDADAIAATAEKNRGTLKWVSPIITQRVSDVLGPGTAVVQARQFEAIARRGKISTYARYSQYPHPPKPLSKLPSDLDEHHTLRPEEEEAVARCIINKQLEEGKIHPHTVLSYLEKSSSVAGMAAQTATSWMNSTEETRQLFVELSLFLAAFLALVFCAFATLAAYIRYQRVFGNNSERKKKLQEYINLDTMLPWWGNDAAYEENVKRIFIEEYRKGRQQAEQLRNYSFGVEQEAKTEVEKKKRELDIFDVSADDVRKMRDRIMKKHAPDETFDGRTGDTA